MIQAGQRFADAFTGLFIEWCDATLNFLRGCSRVSEGCENCYAERMAGGVYLGRPGGAYDGLTRKTNGGPRFEERIDDLLDGQQHENYPAAALPNPERSRIQRLVFERVGDAKAIRALLAKNNEGSGE